MKKEKLLVKICQKYKLFVIAIAVTTHKILSKGNDHAEHLLRKHDQFSKIAHLNFSLHSCMVLTRKLFFSNVF